MFTFNIVVVVSVILLAALFIRLVVLGERARNKRMDEELKQERIQQALYTQHGLTKHFFGIEPKTAHEIHNQDEIVRIVNLLAYKTAHACVEQDKGNRSNNYRGSSLDQEARDAKVEWSMVRKLALQIAPELTDRLPHFSEFEPLKSYREEHLLQKKAAKP